MKRLLTLLGIGSIAFAAIGIGAGTRASAPILPVSAETATLSSLVCESVEIDETRVVVTATAEGTQGFEYTVFSGTAEADGEEKSVTLTVLDGRIELAFDETLWNGYFVVNADEVYSNGESELRFECGYVFDVYAWTVTPVSVLYNPEWSEPNALTANCGALLYGEAIGVASGYAEVNGNATAVALTVDGYSGAIGFSFATTPENFIVRKETLFLGENVAFRFDVSYFFDVQNAFVAPSEATVTVYDGDSFSSVTLEVGSTFTLPTEGNGRGLVGFSDGTTLRPVGDTFTVNGAKVFRATYLETKTDNAASARLDAPYGIRFTSSFETAAYSEIASLEGVAVAFGAEITVSGSEKILDVPTDPVSLYGKDGRTYYHTAVVNIKTKNYALVYECRPYAKLEYANGETKTVYGTGTQDQDGETGRSYAQVLALAYASLDSYEEDMRADIEALYNLVQAAVGVQPVALVYLDGERTNGLNAELAKLLNGSAWRIGEEIDLTAFFESLTPDGYVLSEESVCKGVIGNRGLTIEIYYEKA